LLQHLVDERGLVWLKATVVTTILVPVALYISFIALAYTSFDTFFRFYVNYPYSYIIRLCELLPLVLYGLAINSALKSCEKIQEVTPLHYGMKQLPF
jgi:hypothetical protein